MHEICLLWRGSEIVLDSRDDADGGSSRASEVLHYVYADRDSTASHNINVIKNCDSIWFIIIEILKITLIWI